MLLIDYGRTLRPRGDCRAAMADGTVYLAAGLLGPTFPPPPPSALLSIRSIRSYRLDRPAVALFGAALMLAFGIVTPAQALAAIDLNVLLLLLGMMLLVAGLDVCGFFDLVSRRGGEASRSQVHFLVLLFASPAILPALVLNDTIVLLMTPVVVKACRTLKVNAVPYLVGLALAANIGSVATPVGNPQNAYIAIRGGLPFATFTGHLFLVAALSLLVGLPVVMLVFRRGPARPPRPARDRAHDAPHAVREGRLEHPDPVPRAVRRDGGGAHLRAPGGNPGSVRRQRPRDGRLAALRDRGGRVEPREQRPRGAPPPALPRRRARGRAAVPLARAGGVVPARGGRDGPGGGGGPHR